LGALEGAFSLDHGALLLSRLPRLGGLRHRERLRIEPRDPHLEPPVLLEEGPALVRLLLRARGNRKSIPIVDRDQLSWRPQREVFTTPWRAARSRRAGPRSRPSCRRGKCCLVRGLPDAGVCSVGYNPQECTKVSE